MALFIAMLAIAAATPLHAQTVMGQWITADDYPPSALRVEAEGVVRVILSVDAAGNLADCQVAQSSGNADLDATTCALLRKRAKFVPARDASGQPVASTVAQNFRWAIPHDPLASHGSRLTYSLDEKGHITGCKLAEIGPHDPEAICSPDHVADMTSVFLANSIDHYSSVALLMAMEVDDGTDVNVLRPQGGEHKVVTRSVFTISPAGIVTDCVPVQTAQVKGNVMNMCEGPLKVGRKEFEPFAGTQSRKLTVSFEMTGQPR